MFTRLWLVSTGLFFGSILGRAFAGYWITTIAAILLLVGIFGSLLTKDQSKDKETDIT